MRDDRAGQRPGSEPAGRAGTTPAVDDAPARRGRPGHSLDSLLAVAVALFNERGYDATTMDELAAMSDLLQVVAQTTEQVTERAMEGA